MKTRFTVLKSLVTVFALALALSACAGRKIDVIAGEDGVNHGIARAVTSDSSESKAIDGANAYCSDQNKQAVLVKKETRYTGSMDEGARNAIRTASAVAIMAGGPIGSPVNEAGMIGHSVSSKADYRTEIDFRCR